MLDGDVGNVNEWMARPGGVDADVAAVAHADDGVNVDGA
jgi:hypothetical protein